MTADMQHRMHGLEPDNLLAFLALLGTLRALDTSKPAEEIAKVLAYEVRQTVALHLEGKIDQWWSLTSRLGVVFVMNCKTVEEAHDLLEKLPLGIAGMMTFELHPIGPLKPLMLLAGRG